ncbi:hypothetical protein [Spirochaeta lutea]|uniref:hypothetical protein n=1 Tax=Spirochaeta lutea TaxID=1480694 RepID=UPI0012E0AC93|nr:hypothetical protein [Spirochaeta lutea]
MQNRVLIESWISNPPIEDWEQNVEVGLTVKTGYTADLRKFLPTDNTTQPTAGGLPIQMTGASFLELHNQVPGGTVKCCKLEVAVHFPLKLS